MVVYIICGFLLSIFIIRLKNTYSQDNEEPELHNGHSVGDRQHPSRMVNKSDNILQEICRDLIYLFKNQKLNYGKFVGSLKPLNNVDKVLDNLLIVEDNESFTINKKVIHLCIKEPKSGKYYDKNTLMFVILHELAHVLCNNDIGHTENFFIINKVLLEYAIKHGLYDNSKPFINNYCGLDAKKT
jgi:hypothetical protein